MSGPAGALCDAAGWCWENPLPQGNPILSVWGKSSTDIWAVGGAGAILHFDGSRWSLASSPTHASLYDVWAAAADDAWAVGQGGAILHWSGARWSVVASGTTLDLAAVWGSSTKDVWAAARTSERPDPRGMLSHTFLHWDGTAWTRTSAVAPESSPTNISDMWGCSATEIYAVGTNGQAAAFKWDGTSWRLVMTGPSSSSYQSVWCSGSGRPAWFAENECPSGRCAASISGDGAAWYRTDYAVAPVAASGPTDIWTSATSLSWPAKPHLTLHWNGTSWEELPDTLLAPRFTDKPGSHFRWSGADAAILHRDGLMSAWDSSIQGTLVELHGIWGTAEDNLWAVGERGTILRRSGGAWVAVMSPTTQALSAIWGAAPDQMWAVGADGVLAGNGARWVTLSTGVTGLSAIAGSGPKDVWAAGNSVLLHFDGLGWSTFSTSIGGTSLCATGPSDAWLVSASTVRHFDGTSWSPVSLTDQFKGVWASGPKDVWIAGSKDFYHFDGAGYKTVSSGVDALTGAVWGSGPSDIWARGIKDGQPVNVRWNGTAWTANASDTSQTLRGLFGIKGVGVWGVGTGGSILRYKP